MNDKLPDSGTPLDNEFGALFKEIQQRRGVKSGHSRKPGKTEVAIRGMDRFIGAMNEPTQGTALDEPIVCRVTPWYYRRMGLMAGVCVVFGLYFLYDWKIGYPKANAIADKQEWFEKELLPSYDEAQKSGKLDAWLVKAEAEGWPKGKAGEPPKWLQYSSINGWPEKPKRYTQKEVDEQLWWGMGTLSLGLVAGLVLLVNRGKVLRAGGDHWITPEGVTIRFADVVRVDKRKWDDKGLAYVWHQTQAGRSEQRAVIDDLKFGGADRVLERLLAVFKGELIEKVPDTEAEQEEQETSEKSK